MPRPNPTKIDFCYRDLIDIHIAYIVCSAYNVCMSKIQYTIRNIPEPVDSVIRKRSKQTGKSFNQTVVDMLSLQAFGSITVPKDDDFSWLFNKNTLDDDFDEAINDMSKVDDKLWQ